MLLRKDGGSVVVGEFTDFLVECNDVIANAAYQLAIEIVRARNVGGHSDAKVIE